MIGPALARGNHQGIPTRVSATAISGEGNPGYATIARVIRALNIRMVSEIVQGLADGWSRQEAEEFRAGIQSCEQIDEDWRK